MNGVWITLAIGAIIIIFDWRDATKPDPKSKSKRRKPLTPHAARSLRQLFFGTLVAAGAVWMLGQMFD